VIYLLGKEFASNVDDRWKKTTEQFAAQAIPALIGCPSGRNFLG
jgi:hypothetical protein